MYCAANVAIEQVIEHGEIDVFQAVRTVRRHRVQLVENMVSPAELFHPSTCFKGVTRTKSFISFQTEYKYCYDLVQHYVVHYLNKDSVRPAVVASGSAEEGDQAGSTRQFTLQVPKI